jgi:hypothetical protein
MHVGLPVSMTRPVGVSLPVLWLILNSTMVWLFSFAAYLGAVASVGPGGVPGAVIATIAIFLPGVLLVLAALPAIGWLRGRPGVNAALAGVNAAVVGILAAARSIGIRKHVSAVHVRDRPDAPA